MLTINDLVSENKPCTIQFGDKSLVLQYDPNVITSNMLADMNLSTDEMCRILSELIVSWDLVGKEGEPIKPSFEFLASLNMVIVNKLMQAIFDSAFPKAESTQSSATTARRGRR